MHIIETRHAHDRAKRSDQALQDYEDARERLLDVITDCIERDMGQPLSPFEADVPGLMHKARLAHIRWMLVRDGLSDEEIRDAINPV